MLPQSSTLTNTLEETIMKYNGSTELSGRSYDQTVGSAVTVTVTADPTVWSYDLPDSSVDPLYFIMVSSKVFVNVDDCGNIISPPRAIKFKQVTHDQLEEWLDDPFHKPNYKECLIL